MGVARYSLVAPFDLILIVLVAELCDMRSNGGLPVLAVYSVRLLRTAGKAYVDQRASKSMDDLVEEARAFRSLLPFKQGLLASSITPFAVPEAFIEAVYGLIAPLAKELAERR